MGDMIFANSYDILPCELIVLQAFHLYDCSDLLSILFIRNSNNLDIDNIVQSVVEIFLYLFRVYVLATSDYHVFASAHNG